MNAHFPHTSKYSVIKASEEMVHNFSLKGKKSPWKFMKRPGCIFHTIFDRLDGFWKFERTCPCPLTALIMFADVDHEVFLVGMKKERKSSSFVKITTKAFFLKKFQMDLNHKSLKASYRLPTKTKKITNSTDNFKTIIYV